MKSPKGFVGFAKRLDTSTEKKFLSECGEKEYREIKISNEEIRKHRSGEIKPQPSSTEAHKRVAEGKAILITGQVRLKKTKLSCYPLSV